MRIYVPILRSFLQWENREIFLHSSSPGTKSSISKSILSTKEWLRMHFPFVLKSPFVKSALRLKNISMAMSGNSLILDKHLQLESLYNVPYLCSPVVLAQGKPERLPTSLPACLDRILIFGWLCVLLLARPLTACNDLFYRQSSRVSCRQTPGKP